MKIRKKTVVKVTSASMVICLAVSMMVFPSYAVNADGVNSKGNIVLDNSEEVAFYGSDIDYLENELDSLKAELPDTSKKPYYGTARKSQLNSNGIINYANGTVVFDSSDFVYLSDEIDILESGYKANTVDALNTMGTFFNADGSISHNLNDGVIPGKEATRLSFDTIISGILQSQSVDHLAEQNIVASIEDNLSKGTAAWVNGKLIIGNGADNNTYYEQGFLDGQLSLYDKVSISYVYHEHTGEQSGAGSGCYTGRHNHTSSCSTYEVDDGVCGGSISAPNADGWYFCSNCSYAGKGSGGNSNHHKYHTEYACGGMPYNTWSLTCGKIENVTIESATIVFNN